ncbi:MULTISPECIES: DUF1499 domain-containing protein [unclassified Iodidimonas]|uniref:DUF1499 domain-containing protein n=1 Tax=unclassified Iodidimonas TaxID=2626145 RepID=UPI002482C0DB|nr:MULTISPECIES: DUF1499 domain-containing protein [unclassified Iodidimonas]
MAFRQQARNWRFLSAGLLLLSMLALFLMIAPGPGVRIELWSFGMAISLMRWAFYIAAFTGVVSILALLMAAAGGHNAISGRLALSILLSGAVVTTLYLLRSDATAAVPIHDVTTDLADPPRFQSLNPRDGSPMIVPDRGRSDLADLAPETRWLVYHREAYGDLAPLMLDLPLDEVQNLALAAAKDLGWEIADAPIADESISESALPESALPESALPESALIEATDTTFWYGFKDDIIVRLRYENDQTRVDVRSVSRIGISDLGANAKRIRAFLETLSEKAISRS